MPADDQASAPRRQLKIFRAAEAREVDSTVMPPVNLNPTITEGLHKAAEAGNNNGALLRLLYADEQAKVSLTYSWFKANFQLPIHAHDSDCTYYVISGELHMGNQVLRAGDGFYLPSGTRYSYRVGDNGLEILEFRTAAHFSIDFTGSSPSLFQKMAEVAVANSQRWQEQEKNSPAAVRQFTASRANWLDDRK